MSKKDKTQQNQEPVENIQEALSKTEQFIEKNQKILLYSLAALLGLILIYWLFVNYKNRRNTEAAEQMYMAENYFMQDSFYRALNGGEGYPGFLEIIEDYKGTKAVNLAYFYAGVSLLHLNSYDSAITYLKKFETEDFVLASEKYGAIADAYVQKNDYKSAVKYYLKATSKKYQNQLTTPIYLKKLGLVYEQLGENKKALEVYEDIYKNYPQSQTARTIEKYIERVKLKIEE